MNYTLHQLQVFCKVADKQSVTRAAEELFMTQPAVSIQLKNFQNQFPIALTEVIGRRLYLTDFGKKVAETSRRILAEVDGIKHLSLLYEGVLAGDLKISSASTGKYVIPYFLSGFLEKHPGVDLQLDVTNKTSVIQSLSNNEIDFAFISVIPKDFDIKKFELMSNQLYLVAPKHHTIQIKKPKDLANVPLLFREQGSATRQAMEDYLEQYNVQVGSKVELTSNEAVKQSVVAGLGYSIMPLIGLKNELQNDQLRLIPIKGLPVTTSWNLVWLKQKKMSPVMEVYLDFLKSSSDQIIKEEFSWSNKFKID